MWDNIMNLYVGAMCDQYGDGVELAVFANEDCTWYTNQYAFNDVYSFNANGDANGDGNNANDSINYLMYAEEFIKSAFSELTPCAQLQFADPNGEGEEEGDEQNEMNDYCKGVLEENAVSFVNCAADNEAEEQNQNNNAANYDWFTYDMKEADDANDVCAMLKQKQSGDYSHAYNQEGSGSWYTRDKSGNIVSGKSQQSDGLSAGAIVGIVIAVLAVLLIAVGVGRSCNSSARKRHVDADYSGGEMSWELRLFSDKQNSVAKGIERVVYMFWYRLSVFCLYCPRMLIIVWMGYLHELEWLLPANIHTYEI